MKKYVLLLAMCLTITGCSSQRKDEVIENADAVQTSNDNESEIIQDSEIETIEEVPVLNDISLDNVKEEEVFDPVNVELKTLQKEYKDSNGVVVSKVKIDYPYINNDLMIEGIDKINDFFGETANALFEEYDTYATDSIGALEEVKATKREVIYDNLYSEYQVIFEVKFNKNGYLSILQSFTEKNDGALVENSYSTGYVFHIMDGERLTIDDILLGSNQEISEMIGKAFLESDKIEDRVKTYYQDEIQANTQYVEFYLDKDCIQLFYNPNMVVPYAEGVIQASISYTLEESFKIKLDETSK